jgi:hypothetical protein
MSLDVYLISNDVKIKNSSGIFIRENGQTIEITQEEWNARYPEMESVRLNIDADDDTNTVYSANITHNLTKMADEAGVYGVLWRPNENGITTAKELIDPLRESLHKLKLDPEKYKVFNPENGWGTYDGLVKFIENYLDACYEYPEAKVEVWR